MRRTRDILVVDDEVGTARVLASVLEDAGCRVEIAHNGRMALELLQAAPRDLILLDFLMPQTDGAETLRAIRKKGLPVQVVMMSGVQESIVRRRCKASYDAFLRKPFELDELLRVVKKLSVRT